MMNRFQMSDIDKTANIHFIGIGGISMSGLAQIVLKDGYGVSGSDWNKSAITEKLENMGADIVYGHGAVNEDGINKASLVVYTAAAKAIIPKLCLQRKRHSPYRQSRVFGCDNEKLQARCRRKRNAR